MNDRHSPSRAARRQSWLDRIEATFRAQGVGAAGRLALGALDDGIEDAAILNLAALALHADGRYDEAADLFRRARALSPRDPHILNGLGVCLQAANQLDDALKAYDAALRADPTMAAAHFNRGTVFQALDDIRAARSSYERAAALDDCYAEPLASLAFLDAQAGAAQSARERGERALVLAPANVVARIAVASAALHQGGLQDAATRLADLHRDGSVTPVNRAIVLGLIGDLYDADGNPGEAFAAYQASNAQLKALNAPIFEMPGRESALDQVRRIAGWFDSNDGSKWQEAPSSRPRASDPKAHVFLVGFPRSGTTLLENVLAAHPDVVALEETDCLERVAAPYLSSDSGLERLAGLASGEAMRQRDAYWARVRSFGVDPRGKVFIDKMPLATVQLPVVAKLFSNARVLFARRDPRDVVLSCFRRRFGMNPSMFELLTLEGAATFYDAVMQLADRYRRVLRLAEHVVRYENLVDNLEATISAALEFIGLDWDPALLDFAAKARTRGIDTPSAAQVARGLNREGQGTWRRYSTQMTPVLPLLKPWVERFGYEE